MLQKIGSLCLLFVALSLSFSAFSAEKTTGEYIDDATLATRLITKLTLNKEISIADVKVNTFKRQVQLCGFVKNERQVKEAERVARSVNGVEKIYNFLIPRATIKPKANTVGRYMDDALLTANVKKELYNNTHVSGDISVESYKGTVELCGFVNTSQQISEAVAIAKSVDGVVDVMNHLVAKDQL